MTRPTNVSRLTYLAAALAASVALLASASIADAKSRHHDNDVENNGMSSHASRQHEKKAWHEKKKKEKTVTRTKQCLYITSDGKRCGSGSTAGTKQPSPGKGDSDNSPTPHPSVITISNGVKTYTLPYDPKFSVEVTNPGSITVHSGNQTVTLPGGSITVHGQATSTFAADRAGLQTIINSRGDTVFAIKPQPQSQPPTQLVPTKDSGSGGIVGGVVDAGKAVGNGIVDAGKAVGNGIEDIGLGFINLGGPTPPPPKTSTTIQE
jgi:hypothetical protein